ncbi:hypothetical protein INT48_006049 [Thamnidium elegans]|uniref:Uncharacterized protein n=1 Tax=Thamnidium elegans TaxID=101142 RepID=A0A8H7VT59_9FUNG|nr:hypothetical protein INT48_006049 [Thamnidium elegans]
MSENNNSQLRRAYENIMSVGYLTSNIEDEDIEDEDIEGEDVDDVYIDDEDIEDEDTEYEYTKDEPNRACTQEFQQINTPEGSRTRTLTTGLTDTPEDSEALTTSVGPDNASVSNIQSNTDTNATDDVHVPLGKDTKFSNMIEELTTKKKIIRRIRLPIHPSACIVCRLCLVCSHLSFYTCDDTPRKGSRLLRFMTDSRVIVSDFACCHLREFTIKWIERNARRVYQLLHYANAVPAGYISICSAHSSKYFSDCKSKFREMKNSKRLESSSIQYQMYEEEKRKIIFPSGIFKYVLDRLSGWNQSKVDMHKKKNKSKFHLVCLDTCKLITVDEERMIGRSAEVTNGTNRRPAEGTNRKRGASNELEKSNKRGKKNENSSSSTEEDSNLITVSIWNAPSLNMYTFNASNDSRSVLFHLTEFLAADALVFSSIIAHKRKTFRELFETNQDRITSVDLSQVRFRFVKGYEADINIDLPLNNFPNQLCNGNHLDLYIGSCVRR